MSDLEERNRISYEKLATFDFKNLKQVKTDGKSYTAEEFLEKFIKEINNMKDDIKKYDYPKWVAWKYGNKRDDPDDSKGDNPIIRAIYYLLWGKRIDLGNELNEDGKKADENGTGIGVYEYGWGSFTTSVLFKNENKYMLWGGDTMNTIASYNVNKQIEILWKESGEKEENRVDIMCGKCHQLGNFVLVPVYFNGWRGLKLQDRMDLSLYFLSEILNENDSKTFKEDGFSFEGQFQSKQRDSTKGNVQKKWNVVNKKILPWDKEEFNKYVNIFFLWDYVEPPKEGEKKYVVKNLQYSENNKENSKYITADTIGIYIDNANAYIERRGIFMAAMLEIAVKYENVKIRINDYEPEKEWEEWKVSDIYKYIVKKVFLAVETDSDHNEVIKMYPGYDKVFGAIKEVIRGITKEDGETQNAILDILDNAQKLIEKTAK